AGPPDTLEIGDDSRGAGGGAACRAAHAGAGRRAAEEGARDGRHPPRAGVLMDALDPFRELARTQDERIDLTRAALAVARIEHPDLDVDGEVARLDSLAARSGAAGSRGPPAALDRLVAFLFDEEGSGARAVGRPVKLEEAHWAPCSKHQIVVRMLRNLKGIYAKRQDWDRALGVVDRLLVLDAGSGIHQRDRGTVLVRMGRLHDGVKEW